MGYNIFSHAVNLATIEQAIGSSNKSLFDDILDSETFDLYSSQDFPGSVTTKQALEDLIFDKPYHKESAHSYWYAFIAISAYLGEVLSGTHEINLYYETDFINRYLETDFGVKMQIENTLLNERPLFKLPKVQDWPVHGVLYTADLLLLNEQFKNITITDEELSELYEEDEEKEMAYDSIRQTKENVRFCLENNLTLLSFCH